MVAITQLLLSSHYKNNNCKLMTVVTQPLSPHYSHQFPSMNDKAPTLYKVISFVFKHTTRNNI